jgi:hypothetical protein
VEVESVEIPSYFPPTYVDRKTKDHNVFQTTTDVCVYIGSFLFTT